jgi:hypothetical protein
MIIIIKVIVLGRLECLWVRPRAYPRVEHLEGASLGYATAFLINIGGA